MIGNLVNVLAIALVSGSIVFAADRQAVLSRPEGLNVMVAESTSNIEGIDFAIYTPNIDLNFATLLSYSNQVPENYISQFISFDNISTFDNSYDGSFDDLYDSMYLNPTYAGGCGISALYDDNVTPSGIRGTYKIHFKFASNNSNIVWNNLNYSIDAFEFKPFVELSDGTYLNTDSYTFSVNRISSLRADKYYGFLASAFLGNGSNYVDVYYYDLVVTIPRFVLPNTTTNFEVGVDGRWYCNFSGSNSYSRGYYYGFLDGHDKGYAEGLATAQQSSFMGLFNSIADTPLRFLYGLFSFDLFGTSMLVIVLTLLTGIVLFGIIKKFWK